MQKDHNKKAVSSVRSYLAAINKPISQAQGYEVLSRALNLKDANTLAGVTKAADPKTVAEPVFTGDHAAYLDVLAGRHSLNEIEIEHALAALGDDYDDETVIPLANGRAIHCPAYPAECEYVRVVLEGYELMYWHCDEWAESPMEVMGALLGLAHG
jgi:hypothetical protein